MCIADVQRTAKRLRQEEPEISQEEIEAFLGEPEEVARMFEDTLDAAQVEQYRSRKKMRFGILIGVLLAGIIAALCLAYYMMVNRETDRYYQTEGRHVILEQRMGQYCQRVRASLRCPARDAKRCITDVQRTAERLRQEEPKISPEEIEEFLGEPEEVARMFQDTLDPVRVEWYHRRKRLLLGLLVGVLLLGVLGALYFAYCVREKLQFTYTETFYIGEEVELAPDDPRAACLYE